MQIGQSDGNNGAIMLWGRNQKNGSVTIQQKCRRCGRYVSRRDLCACVVERYGREQRHIDMLRGMAGRATVDDAVVRHLVFGLKRIADLKNSTRCKDPTADLIGEPGEGAGGFRPIHPRMKRGLDLAARMARETLDSMPDVTDQARAGKERSE